MDHDGQRLATSQIRIAVVWSGRSVNLTVHAQHYFVRVSTRPTTQRRIDGNRILFLERRNATASTLLAWIEVFCGVRCSKTGNQWHIVDS
jgi:hypothetical protein